MLRKKAAFHEVKRLFYVRHKIIYILYDQTRKKMIIHTFIMWMWAPFVIHFFSIWSNAFLFKQIFGHDFPFVKAKNKTMLMRNKNNQQYKSHNFKETKLALFIVCIWNGKNLWNAILGNEFFFHSKFDSDVAWQLLAWNECG